MSIPWLLVDDYNLNTYRVSAGSCAHLRGRLMSGWGHARHGIVSPPGGVAFIPAGLWARPACFAILMCLHSLTMSIHWAKRSSTILSVRTFLQVDDMITYWQNRYPISRRHFLQSTIKISRCNMSFQISEMKKAKDRHRCDSLRLKGRRRPPSNFEKL